MWTPEERRAYDIEYRRKNRDRIREVRRQWRANNREKITTAEIERRKRRRQENHIVELPSQVPLYGHPLYDEAVKVVGPRKSSLHTLYDSIYEDFISVVLLAILDNKCPHTELKEFKRNEFLWRYMVAIRVEEIETLLDVPMVFGA
jgi:hypothetical protein